MNEINGPNGQYIVVKALENGVNIIGMTRGRETKLLHTEKLDKGEICFLQFTENISAMKVRGRAEVYTQFGVVQVQSE